MPALAPPGASLKLLRVGAGTKADEVRVDYLAFGRLGQTGRQRWVTCGFGPGAELLTLATEGGPVGGANLYLLRHYYLDTPEAAAADPGRGTPSPDEPASSLGAGLETDAAHAHILRWNAAAPSSRAPPRSATMHETQSPYTDRYAAGYAPQFPVPYVRGSLGARFVAYLLDILFIFGFTALLTLAITVIGVLTFGLGWTLFAILPASGILYSAITVGARPRAPGACG